MLFPTPEFIYLFLPAAVLLHFTLARWNADAAIIGTTVSSLLFYAWWNPPFVVVPVLSIAANFWLARWIQSTQAGRSRGLMIFGVAANLLVLCYFKYTDFLLSIIDGHAPRPPDVPLALSFTTFVQIAFLVYVHQRRSRVAFDHYALFVAFFPHLIAGPIVRWGSFGKQIGEPERYRVDWSNFALGLTIFVFGLAKKVLIADPLSPHVGLVFGAASQGDPVTAFAAWAGCVAFSLQVYFDFSGYSDMAVGLGLLFNYRLPINFAAPLRATSISDLWRRWHITLARLCRDLIYVPLARDRGPLRRWFSLWFTMVAVGVWHGAGWTFVLWGGFQGLLLLINQWWRQLRGPRRATRLGRVIGWVLTFGAFAASMSLFRAADLDASWNLISSMAGFGHAPIADRHLAADDWMIRHGYFVSSVFVRTWFGSTWTVTATFWTLAALLIALALPDTMEVTGYREGDAQSDWRRHIGFLAWRPSFVSLAAVAAIFAVVFTKIGQVSEFFYFQF
jgi:D-alanyl-lipoteichoic acid acyltransferase DltB (MBOAT superfamily)